MRADGVLASARDCRLHMLAADINGLSLQQPWRNRDHYACANGI